MSARTEVIGRDASGREMDRVMVGKVEGRDSETIREKGKKQEKTKKTKRRQSEVENQNRKDVKGAEDRV